MDILGIGPLELIVILLVALAVFGPDRLPTIGAKLGRALRDMRKATHEFSREIEAARQAIEAPLNEVKEPLQQIGGAVQGATALAQAARNPGQALRDAVVRELSTGSAAEDAPQPAATPPPATPPDETAVPFSEKLAAPEPASEPASDEAPTSYPAGDTVPTADEAPLPTADVSAHTEPDTEEAR